jgi:hypothetical protein
MRRMVVLLLVLTSACFSYRTLETGPVPGRHVKITLAGPTAIETVLGGVRDTSVGVIEATGTVRAATADTITLALDGLYTIEGLLPGSAGVVAYVPARQVTRVQEREFEAGKTVATGIGVYGLAAFGALLWIMSQWK